LECRGPPWVPFFGGRGGRGHAARPPTGGGTRQGQDRAMGWMAAPPSQFAMGHEEEIERALPDAVHRAALWEEARRPVPCPAVSDLT